MTTLNRNGITSVQGQKVADRMDDLLPATAGTVEASKIMVPDANKDLTGLRNLTISGNLVAGSSTISTTEIAVLDAVTAGTVTASKAVVVDANKDIGTFRNVTLSGNLVTGSTTLSEAELGVLDSASSAQVVVSKAVIADANGKINLYRIGSAAASASGLLAGVGTSANPAATATASANFVEIRAKTTATSGDNRLGYFRYDIGGAGASGECLRAFTDLTAAAATARGTQISLQAGATGYVTGLGVGVDAQLYIKNEALAANGTYAVVNAEIYSAGSTSSVAAATEVAFFRVANSGDGTGAGTVDAKAYLFDLTGFTSGSANLWYDHQGTAPTNVEEWIKVKTPAGDRWLALYNAVV